MSDEPYQITERGDPRDRIANQRPLFDTTQLELRCPICAAQRTPGNERTPDCGVDLSRAAGDWLRRPAECLNHPRPETDPFPQGF